MITFHQAVDLHLEHNNVRHCDLVFVIDYMSVSYLLFIDFYEYSFCEKVCNFYLHDNVLSSDRN